MPESRGTEFRQLLFKNLPNIIYPSNGKLTFDIDFVAVIASSVYETDA